jgi:hypothetical protein
MRIALDYDDTYTADKLLWDRFIIEARRRNHSVYFVTGRCQNNDNSDIELDAYPLELPIIYCSQQPKRDFINADIWIDDMPEAIVRDKPIGDIK